MNPSPDDGYFPRGCSILRRVHGERAVGLLFGQRSLMLGAMMHPLAYFGTTVHTNAKQAPWQRLAHTGKVFETVFFGSRADADRALAFVRVLHDRVRGTLDKDLGPWPAGTPYSAYDPELMLAGVVAPTFDSAQRLYETLVRPLDAGEREGLWREYLRFGELFGMPADSAPASYGEFRAWWDERLASDEVFLTDEARVAGYQVGFGIPVPLRNGPAMRMLEFLLAGSLPERARELYGIPWGRRDRITFDAIAAASRRSRPVVPRRLRRGSCEFLFDLVARTERRQLRDGRAPAMFAGDARRR